MKLRELLERPTRACVCIRGRLPLLFLCLFLLLLPYPRERNLDSYLVRAWRGETVAKILRVPGA